jgi:hypothetical protein
MQNTLDSQTQTIASLQTDLQTLQNQMATLEQENQTVIDFAAALDLSSLIYNDAEGNLNLGAGELKAAGVETGMLTLQGPFVVKVTDQGAKNIGQAAICPSGQLFDAASGQCADSNDASADGTVSEVKTTAVDQNSKIYITPTGSTGNQVLYVSKVDPGNGFSVKIDNPAKAEIDFNWWVVEESGNSVPVASQTDRTGTSQSAVGSQNAAVSATTANAGTVASSATGATAVTSGN